jgi:hypothetical protein
VSPGNIQPPIEERSARERDQLELIDHLRQHDRRVADALLTIAEHISSSGNRSLAPALCTVLAFALRSVLRTEEVSE